MIRRTNFFSRSLCISHQLKRLFPLLTHSYCTASPQPPSSVERIALPDGRCFTGRFTLDSAKTKHPASGTTLEEDGDLYTGEFNADWKRHGAGKAWLADGTHYDGRFSDDDFVEGTVSVPDGADSIVFTGTLRDEQFHHGTLRSRGVVYTGDFEHNAPHGAGFMQLPRGGYLKGAFFRGKLHGKGTLKLENGYVYSGNFVHGLLTAGELRTRTFKYEGQLNQGGLPSGMGRGEMLTASEKLIFEGQWDIGRVVSGVCKDEHGNAVDYLNRPDLQRSLMAEEDLMMNEYCLSKKVDFVERDKQLATEYAREASATSAKDNTKIGLGYEYGPTNTVRLGEEKMAEQCAQDKVTRASAVPELTDLYTHRCERLDMARLGAEGVDVTRMQREIRAEYGTRHLVRQNLEEQYVRFRRRNGMPVESAGPVNPNPKFAKRNELWAGYYT